MLRTVFTTRGDLYINSLYVAIFVTEMRNFRRIFRDIYFLNYIHLLGVRDDTSVWNYLENYVTLLQLNNLNK